MSFFDFTTRIVGRIGDAARDFRRDVAGGMSTFSVVITTGVVAATAVVVDGGDVRNHRALLQSVADIAALNGVKAVAHSNDPTNDAIAITHLNLPTSKYGNVINGNNVDMGIWNTSARTFSTVNDVGDANAVRVKLEMTSDNGNPLPLALASVLDHDTANISATAIAVMHLKPLCMLALDPNGQGIRLTQNNDIFSTNCTIWSNKTGVESIAAMKTSSQFSTGDIRPCAVGQAFGQPSDFSAWPRENCDHRPDPLANSALPSASGCNYVDVVVDVNQGFDFQPGVYCGVEIKPNADPLYFAAGTYIFKDGNFHINNNNEIYGTNVNFHFEGASDWIVEANAEITLTGRQSGTYAGFVITAARNHTGTFTIESNTDFDLEGVVYIPNTTFGVGADTHVSVSAPWAGFIVKDLVMWANADVTLNVDPTVSPVPVPAELLALFTTVVR